MAAIILASDEPSGASFARDEKGWKYTRKYQVGGLDAYDPSERMYQAALCSGIPQYGQLHPKIPNLFVINAKTTHNDNSGKTAQVEVEYAYGDPSSAFVEEWGATIVTVKTSRNKDGLEMFVLPPYIDSTNHSLGRVTTGQKGTPLLDNKTGGSLVQPAIFDIQVAVPYFTVRRRETVASFQTKVIENFVGHVNSDTFRNRSAQKWYCANIRATYGGDVITNDTILVSYEFQLNEKTWNGVYAYKDPDTDAPIAGCNFADSSMGSFPIYPEVAFSGLGL